MYNYTGVNVGRSGYTCMSMPYLIVPLRRRSTRLTIGSNKWDGVQLFFCGLRLFFSLFVDVVRIHVPLTLLESVAIVGGCGLREGWVLSFGVLEGRFGVGCWIR